jgi:hypothetical protein
VVLSVGVTVGGVAVGPLIVQFVGVCFSYSWHCGKGFPSVLWLSVVIASVRIDLSIAGGGGR